VRSKCRRRLAVKGERTNRLFPQVLVDWGDHRCHIVGYRTGQQRTRGVVEAKQGYSHLHA